MSNPTPIETIHEFEKVAKRLTEQLLLPPTYQFWLQKIIHGLRLRLPKDKS